MGRIILAIFSIFLIPQLTDKMLVMSESYCYSEDSEPYNYFALITAYEHVHARNLSAPSDCEIRYIWALIRHGTRYAAPKYHKAEATENVTKIKNQIIENHEIHKRGKLCEKDLKLLKNWTCQWSSKYALELTSQGIADMEGIATRLKSKFKSYFDEFEKKFLIQTTYKRRCQQSALAFTNKLFGTSYTTIIGNDITINDELLYIGFDNPSDGGHSIEFSKTNIVKNMIDEIKERLGYESQLNFQFVDQLHRYCRYENAWFPNSRPGICAVFTPENLKIMEYFGDIRDFYLSGPLNRTAKKLACPIVRDIYAKMIAAANNSDGSQKGTFYFGHQETLLPTLVHLGLFQNEVSLREDNYEFLSNRKWRTSYVTPFAANLYVILSRCSQGLKISFYNNENKLQIPGCNGRECSMKEFQEIFEKIILKDCMENKSKLCTPLNALLILNMLIFFSPIIRWCN